jgi:hypothetical protein
MLRTPTSETFVVAKLIVVPEMERKPEAGDSVYVIAPQQVAQDGIGVVDEFVNDNV